MINDTVQSLLNKEVSRKEFLQHVGFAIVAATGMATIIKSLQSHHVTPKSLNHTYGASAYGGKRR